jgi:hypothetical protein
MILIEITRIQLIPPLQMEEDNGVKTDDLPLGNTLLRLLKYWSEFDFVHTGIFLKNNGGFFKKVRDCTPNVELLSLFDHLILLLCFAGYQVRE